MRRIGKGLAHLKQKYLPPSNGLITFEEFSTLRHLRKKWPDSKTRPPFLGAQIERILNRMAKTPRFAKGRARDAHDP